jgi:LPXTG-motif cell wall-anchored protein
VQETIVRRVAPARKTEVRVAVLAALAVLTLAGTYLAAQVDFLRRHTVGFPAVDPKKYWLPQVTHIWLPGLGAAALLALAAFVLHRRRRAA